MKDFLNLLQSFLLIVYCIFGSAAFLKYLLLEERSVSRSRKTKKTEPRRQRPKPIPVPTEEPAVPAAEHTQPFRQPEPQTVPERAPAGEPIQYPQDPPPGVPASAYEVANPGYKLSDGYRLQLQPSDDGVLLASSLGDAVCVYVQPGLEDASVNLKWLGLKHLYDMYDQNGNLYRVLPDGRLRIQNLQPAVCAQYGSNLTLQSKGRLFVTRIDEEGCINQGY